MSTTVDSAARPGRLLAWLGFLLALTGPAIYTVQLVARRLTMPWYLPALGTLGLLLAIAAVVQRRGLWRILSLVLCLLLAAAEWVFLVFGSVLPNYTGPVAKGQPFPALQTTLSDGSKFSQDQLKGPQRTALVFFRGRW